MNPSAGVNSKKRMRIKELRVWNAALSETDFGTYDRITMPKRYPELAAVVKFDNLDFYEAIYGVQNYQATFDDYMIKYDSGIRNNCPLGMR